MGRARTPSPSRERHLGSRPVQPVQLVNQRGTTQLQQPRGLALVTAGPRQAACDQVAFELGEGSTLPPRAPPTARVAGVRMPLL